MHIRQLAAIMFTDLVGYTLSMQKSEEVAIKKRDRSRKILEESLAKHEGKLLQYYGDGALSIFTSGVNAVKSIVKIEAMMEQMPEANLDFAVTMLCADIGEMEKFRRSCDRAIERKAQWMVQFYGTEMSRSIWYDEHVIATRKKLGLPVYERQVKSQ